jgi:hypothetical protein
MTPEVDTQRPRRHHPRLGFVIPAVLAILAVVVLHGPAAGVAALGAMLSFIGACMYALRSQDADAIERGQRTALGGWVGGWF